MKSLKSILVLVIIGITLITCNKDDKNLPSKIIVSGIVTDTVSLKPIDSVQITLSRTLGELLVAEVGNFYTDSLGQYNIQYSPISGKSYWIVLTKKGFKSRSKNLEDYKSSQVYNFQLERDSTFKQ